MEIKNLLHKHGGRITAIHSVAHSTHKGVADWYYVGDVEWQDGGKSVGTEIPPWALCIPEGNTEARKEYGTVSDKLNAHLRKNGKWHDMKHHRDGRCYSWTPKKDSAQTSV